MSISTILEPISDYNLKFKKQIVENAQETFDKLAQTAQVSEATNQEIIGRLRKAEAHLNIVSKKAGTIKGWRTFLTVMLVLAGVAALACIFLLVLDSGFSKGGLIGGLVGSIVFLIGGVLLDILVIKKRASFYQKLVDEAQAKVNNIRDEAYAQMSPLFRKFDWYIPMQVIEKTCPAIHIDRIFDAKKMEFLVRYYGWKPVGYDDKNRSIMNVVSGTISENPFLIVKELEHTMGTKTYTGSCTYTYTVWVGSGDDRHMETRTDTLFASLTKPFPLYSEYNYIIYGNPAAERLVFTRHPSGVDKGESDKKIDKIVKKGSKKLDKLEEKQLTDNNPNTNFQKMSNDKFEVLFGATDRNDEVQFRVLFSPAVQVNMTKLILEGLYGDDFSFFKRCKMNIIVSRHSQGFDYGCHYATWIDIDYKLCKQKFVNYTSNFFNYLYFDLAPLLSITLYQTTRPHLFEYSGGFERKYTSYEDEAMANEMGEHNFSGPGFDTRCVLKSKFLKNKGDTDYSLITSYSYTRVPMVDYVERMGRDGLLHTIPIYYDIYEPITGTTTIGTKRFDGTDEDYLNMKQSSAFEKFQQGNIGNNQFYKYRGLVAFMVAGAALSSIDPDFDSFISIK